MFTHDPTRPDDASLAALRTDLARLAIATDREGPWRSGAFNRLAEHGLLAGFIAPEDGGTGATEPALLEALTAVASACLTTALVLTQWASACRLLATGPADLRDGLLPRLARGEETATVGIAQLMTGADSSDSIVTGAVAADGTPRFFIIPTSAAGLTISAPMPMLALSGSRTSSVAFDGVEPRAEIVSSSAAPARAGGLATSALAIGSTRASIALIAHEAAARPALEPVATSFRHEADALAARLGWLAGEEIPDPAARDALRTAANSLVVRAAQAALTATKGAGFIAGHPAERGIRESMLFLVWSCPQQVASAVICELAHLDATA